MRYLQPIPWRDVRPGTVVLVDTVPRAVLATDGTPTSRMIFVEGLAPIVVDPMRYAQPVELDTADAVGNLFAAGFTITPIEGS